MNGRDSDNRRENRFSKTCREQSPGRPGGVGGAAPIGRGRGLPLGGSHVRWPGRPYGTAAPGMGPSTGAPAPPDRPLAQRPSPIRAARASTRPPWKAQALRLPRVCVRKQSSGLHGLGSRSMSRAARPGCIPIRPSASAPCPHHRIAGTSQADRRSASGWEPTGTGATAPAAPPPPARLSRRLGRGVCSHIASAARVRGGDGAPIPSGRTLAARHGGSAPANQGQWRSQAGKIPVDTGISDGELHGFEEGLRAPGASRRSGGMSARHWHRLTQARHRYELAWLSLTALGRSIGAVCVPSTPAAKRALKLTRQPDHHLR